MKMKKLGLFICLCTVFCLLVQIPAFAADEGTITVDFSTKNHTNGIDGAEFTLFKVLDLTDGKYTVCEGMDVSVEDVLENTEETVNALAEKLSKEDGKSAVTVDGKAVFSGLSDGVWILVQTDRTGEALDYSLSAPAAVGLPQWSADTLTYSVTVYPKTTYTPVPTPTPSPTPTPTPTPTPSKTANTGDASDPVFWAVVCGTMVLAAAAMIVTRRKLRDEK